MDTQLMELSTLKTYAATGIDLDKTLSVERKRILIIEDDLDTAVLLKRILILAGYDVANALGGVEGLQKCVHIKPDLVLLDLRMPEMDGWETLQSLRNISQSPVIIVSANGAKDDIVRALMDGVDDYLTKPFFNAEVVARVQSVLRRFKPTPESSSMVFPRVGLSVDLLSQEVTLRNQKITLTPKEFSVLVLLAKQAPALVRYETISQSVWGEVGSDAHNRTKYLIYLIRRKLQSIAPGINLIINVDRVGYKLIIEA